MKKCFLQSVNKKIGLQERKINELEKLMAYKKRFLIHSFYTTQVNETICSWCLIAFILLDFFLIQPMLICTTNTTYMVSWSLIFLLISLGRLYALLKLFLKYKMVRVVGLSCNLISCTQIISCCNLQFLQIDIAIICFMSTNCQANFVTIWLYRFFSLVEVHISNS